MARRVPVITREQVAEEHAAAYDEITSMFTTSIGYFRMLALNANAFTIDLPQQRTEPLLPNRPADNRGT